MLAHLRRRIVECLSQAGSATLATSGEAGLQASRVPCEAVETRLYLLVPRTSDHLLNLEASPDVIVVTEAWSLRGLARVLGCRERPGDLALLRMPAAAWSDVVEVRPSRLHINPDGRQAYAETIDVD